MNNPKKIWLIDYSKAVQDRFKHMLYVVRFPYELHDVGVVIDK